MSYWKDLEGLDTQEMMGYPGKWQLAGYSASCLADKIEDMLPTIPNGYARISDFPAPDVDLESDFPRFLHEITFSWAALTKSQIEKLGEWSQMTNVIQLSSWANKTLTEGKVVRGRTCMGEWQLAVELASFPGLPVDGGSLCPGDGEVYDMWSVVFNYYTMSYHSYMEPLRQIS